MTSTERQPDQLITLPRRGLRIIAPKHVNDVMILAKKHCENNTRFTEEEKNTLWPETEKARIYLIKKCGTLAKRYPTKEQGREFMNQIDYARREELFEVAVELTSQIVNSWVSINEKPIAVILFGSVSKGLVKKEDHPDPSNIDLAVIGNISQFEREKLLDEIRPHRHRVQRWILDRVPIINSRERNPGNVGMMIQNTDKLKKDNFEPTKNYIASGAIALHDPEKIWQDLENNALLNAAEKLERQKIHRLKRRGLIFKA